MSPERDAPSVDVVIPVHNNADSLQRAVDSVLRQSTGDWLLTIVDDGSTDGGVGEFADPRIRVVRQENRGPGAARNHGARLGAAAVLAFLDADDEWAPDFLAEMTAVLAARPAVAAASARWRGPRAVAEDAGPEVAELRWSPTIAPAAFKQRVDAMHTSGTVVRRAVFERFGGFYEGRCTYGEDSYLWAAIALTGTVAAHPGRLLTFHVDHSGLSAGRVGPYPLPPLLTDHARFRRNVEDRWDAFMPHYLEHYAAFLLRRSAAQGALGQIARFVLTGRPRALGLGRGWTGRVLRDCAVEWGRGRRRAIARRGSKGARG